MLRVAWCMKLGEGSLFSVNYLLHVACCMDFLKSTLFSVKNLQLIVHIIFKNLCFLPTDMQHATCNMQHATCNYLFIRQHIAHGQAAGTPGGPPAGQSGEDQHQYEP
jgi:hypothetical protein